MTTAYDPRFAGPPDELARDVLFAVELIDPVTQSLVWQGITVTAAGIQGKPIVNRSGRFVWLLERNAWPGVITIDSGRTPFSADTAPAPPRPADLMKALPAERLVRVVLRPTSAYPFDAGGITVVRGDLKDSTIQPPPSPYIAGARMQLAWFDTFANTWLPPAPQPGDVLPDTNVKGQFAVLLRLNAPAPAVPDFQGRLLKVRVQVTRGAATRATPGNFPFLPNAVDAGRVPEGSLLPTDVALDWNQLTPI